jgi:3-hydroxy-3-methylglutaryl CoA synthase
MVGITSIRTYIPLYRLSGDEIAGMWGGRNLGGEKAVAGCDEDSVTMAVGAGLDAMRDYQGKIDRLYFATTTAPYKEKQGAAIIASAVDLDKSCYTGDFTNSLRAGSLALKSAVDGVQCGSAVNILVIASDCRVGAAQSTFEQILGDGAASIIIGSQNVIADIEDGYSIFNEFTDAWRTEEDVFERGSEERFVDTAGYRPVVKEVVSNLMDRHKLAPKDFSKVVFYAPDARSHNTLGKSLGFDGARIQDPLFAHIGNTGTAASFIMLAAALDTTEPGDRILFVTYGDGADAFILRVTEEIRKVRNRPMVTAKLERKMPIRYAQYAMWRGLVRIEASRLPERPPLSVQCLSRERKNVLGLYGVKCRSCGTPQYPASRVCVVCHTKDNFEDYKFSHRKGTLFTYSVDHLQPTLNPPGVNGVVDFDGGGRLVCELTDCDPAHVEAGMPVEMTFRKLYQSIGINSYFWKAKPISGG